MHCPQCGLEQVSGETRFCRACGFELEDVKILVSDKRSEKARERRRNAAFNQGLGLMLVSLVLVIVMTLVQDLGIMPQFLVKFVAAFFILAGLFRMFYPYVVSGDRSVHTSESDDTSIGPETTRLDALPPHDIPAAEWASRRRDTSDPAHVPSVTEHTTRKLDLE